ncbi:MAG TPA: TlyA family RNA methyltransferase [Candidatus Saccharimonadia bacterium]|jgi:23S rRNA (cytidine1920-2'-O)/16S rRNA (cytidine1409-2'-O)-methyltransferase|nr:TlyA family RNA methyltransferase [Candidatus Saccharimonadia bacterium]
MAKQRLDQLLVERGLVATRSQAQALIMAGQVSADGKRLEKPGMTLDSALELHVKDQPRYASRAGEKLASAAAVFGLEFEGRVVLDVGSSTGGFTDFALQHGAARVYCVDVGTGQLAFKLRHDPRVVVMERTDIRDAQLPEQPDMAVMDVSFISLTKVLEATAGLVKSEGEIIAMAKPQFEAGKALADKYHGVIPMGPERDEVLENLREWIRERFEIVAEADSGLAGAEGNVERFLLLRRLIDGK